MTEDQHINLVEVGDRFWNLLGEMVAIAVSKFPAEIEDEVLDYLQDRCSVYSTDYRGRLEVYRKKGGDPMTSAEEKWAGCIGLLIDVMPTCGSIYQDEIENAVDDFCQANRWEYERHDNRIKLWRDDGERMK